MQRRFSLMALVFSTVGFVLQTGIWFALNQFRRGSYNSAMEGPSREASPYWTIIRLQSFLQWLIIFSLLFAVLMLVFEFAHYLASATSNRRGR